MAYQRFLYLVFHLLENTVHTRDVKTQSSLRSSCVLTFWATAEIGSCYVTRNMRRQGLLPSYLPHHRQREDDVSVGLF